MRQPGIHVDRPGQLAPATLDQLIPRAIAQIEPHRQTHASAAEEIEQLQQMLESWRAYKAGNMKECVEQFGAAVAHDSQTLNPQADPAFEKYVAQALLSVEKDSRVDAAAVAAATAFFCLSSPGALKLNDTTAGRKLDALADRHPGNWYVQYSKATWRVLRGDHKKSAEALTKAIDAGGPCGLYYTRARVYSNMQQQRKAAADYSQYLSLAPPDSRSIPDAHYALALDYCMAQPPDIAAARRHFAAGQAAEAQVGPYQGSQAKMMAQLLMSAPAFQGR